MPEIPTAISTISSDPFNNAGTASNARADAAFQSHMGHISRQSSVFFAGTVFTMVTGYVFKVYLARVLGAESLGIYALGMTMVGLLGVFNGIGIPQAAVRFVAAYFATGRIADLRRFLARGVALLLASNLLFASLLVWGGPWAAIHLYHAPVLAEYFGFFAWILGLGSLTTFMAQVLAGYKDVTRRTVITNFVGGPIMMLLTVALIVVGLGLRGYLLAQVASVFCVLVLLTISILRTTPAGPGFFRSAFLPLEREVLSFSAFAFMVTLAEFLMAQSDKMLIGFYLNVRDVGVYAIAMALIAFIPIVLQSINQIFSPVIADLYAREEHAMLGRLFQTLTKWIFGLTLPLAAVMVIFAPFLMRIFGREFSRGWPILIIGAIAQLANCGTGSVGYLLQMSGRQRELLKIQIVMVFAMIALGVLLIPRWGIVGAAVAGGVVNVLSNWWYLYEVRRKLNLWPYNKSYLQLMWPFASTLCILLIERRFLVSFHLDAAVIAFSLFSGYLAFAVTALHYGLDDDDRMLLRAIWERTGGRFRNAGAVR